MSSGPPTAARHTAVASRKPQNGAHRFQCAPPLGWVAWDLLLFRAAGLSVRAGRCSRLVCTAADSDHEDRGDDDDDVFHRWFYACVIVLRRRFRRCNPHSLRQAGFQSKVRCWCIFGKIGLFLAGRFFQRLVMRCHETDWVAVWEKSKARHRVGGALEKKRAAWNLRLSASGGPGARA